MRIESSESGWIYYGHNNSLTKEAGEQGVSRFKLTRIGKKRTRDYKYKLGFRRQEDTLFVDPLVGDVSTTLSDLLSFVRAVEDIAIGNQIEKIIAPMVANPKLEAVLPRFGFTNTQERQRLIPGLKYPSKPPRFEKKLDNE